MYITPSPHNGHYNFSVFRASITQPTTYYSVPEIDWKRKHAPKNMQNYVIYPPS